MDAVVWYIVREHVKKKIGWTAIVLPAVHHIPINLQANFKGDVSRRVYLNVKELLLH